MDCIDDRQLGRVIRSIALQSRIHQPGNRSDNAHELFALLYYFTTKSWLEFARTCPDPVLMGLLVLHFFRLYEGYVLSGTAGRGENIAHHRRHHVRLLDHSRSRKPLLAGIVLLIGIRTHIRYDLAEAICDVHDSYTGLYRRKPDMRLLRSMIFGEGSNRVFRRACLEFFRTKAASGDLPARVLLHLAGAFDWLWMPVFQWLRRSAWLEAMRSISSGVPIRRQASG